MENYLVFTNGNLRLKCAATGVLKGKDAVTEAQPLQKGFTIDYLTEKGERVDLCIIHLDADHPHDAVVENCDLCPFEYVLPTELKLYHQMIRTAVSMLEMAAFPEDGAW